MKICRKCEKVKGLDEFHKWKEGKDGLCLYCKECVSNERKVFLKENHEKLLHKRKEQREKEPERFRKYCNRTYIKYREKYKKNQRIYNEKNREIINEKRKKYYFENREVINAKERIYLSSEKGKLRSNEYYHKTKERFDLKIKARNKVRYAVRVGNLIKPEICEKCFEKKLLHGHHEDYSKPLEVIWVCVYCHKNIHKSREN